MRKILTVGACVYDTGVFVEKMPKGNEDIMPLKKTERISGFGYCTAGVFSLLNLPYDLCAPVGSGVYGEAVRRQLKDDGIPFIDDSETAGCTYTIIDGTGRAVSLTAEGGEYRFRKEYIPADLNDYAWMLISGNEMHGPGRDELSDCISSFHGNLLFRPGERGALLDLFTLDGIYQNHPVLHLNRNEALTIARTQNHNLEQVAHQLHKETGNAVIICLEDGTVLYHDGSETIATEPFGKKVIDESGMYDSHAAAFAAGRLCGLRPKQALSFAKEYASAVSRCETAVLPAAQRDVFRKKLAAEILDSGQDKKIR